MADETYFQTDEAEDVAASVRHALRCWAMTKDDPHAWKWFALALHSALQGACVDHLLTTATPVGPLTARSNSAWMDYFEASRNDDTVRPPARTELMALPDLLKTVRKAGTAGNGTAAAILIDDGDFSWLRRFHDEIRNQFVHFEPMGWSLEVSGMAGLAKLVSRIVGDVLEAGWAFRAKKLAWKDALKADLAALAALA